MRKINLQIPRINSLDEARNVIEQVASASVERFFTWLRAPYFGGQRLREVGQPTSSDDAATKQYVDTVVEEASLGGESASTTNLIKGASNLRTVGAIPKVTSAGTLGESALSDDGSSSIIATGRVLKVLQAISGATQPTVMIDDTSGVKVRLTRITSDVRGDFLVNLTFDGTDFNLDDTSKPGLRIALHETIGFRVTYYPAGSNPVTASAVHMLVVDPTGNADIPGVYKVGGVSGVSGALTLGVVHSTIQYKDWAGVNQSASVVTSVSITSNAFTGGIRTT